MGYSYLSFNVLERFSAADHNLGKRHCVSRHSLFLASSVIPTTIQKNYDLGDRKSCRTYSDLWKRNICISRLDE